MADNNRHVARAAEPSTREKVVLAVALASQLFMLGAFFRLLWQVSQPALQRMAERMPISPGSLVIGIAGVAIVAAATAIFIWPRMWREFGPAQLTPEQSAEIGARIKRVTLFLALGMLGAVAIAVVIPSVEMAVVILLVAFVIRIAAYAMAATLMR